MYRKFKWTSVGEDRNAILQMYEPIQPYLLIELAKKLSCDTFVDIGANIGAYSIFMASIECIKAIHSFEASSITFQELSQNIRLNQDDGKVQAYNVGVSSEKKTLRFGIVSKYSGANGIVDTSFLKKGSYEETIEIECVALDDVLSLKDRVICLKIDVEGHERDVLLGAKKILSNNTCILQLEAYKENGHDTGAKLIEYGYRRLCKVGPDSYFSNSAEGFESNEIVGIFERAASALIQANLDRSTYDGGNVVPVRVKLGGGLAVEVSGAVANIYRQRLRKYIRR